MMVYVVSGLPYEFPFGRELIPWQRGRTEGGVHCGKYSATAASVWQHPGWKQILSVRTQPILSLSLQLVAVIALCITPVNQLGMDFWNLLRPKHSWCNRMVLLTTLFLRVGEHRIAWNRFSPFSLCVTCEKCVIMSRENGSKTAETQVKTFISFNGFWIGPLRTCFDRWSVHWANLGTDMRRDALASGDLFCWSLQMKTVALRVPCPC